MKLSSRTTKILLRKIILTIAIIMMASSALLNYFYVLSNDPKVSALKMSVQDKQSLVRDVWNNVVRRENKIDIIFLLKLLQNKNYNETAEVIYHYLNDYPEIPKNATIIEILSALDNSKKSDLNTIDNLYFEQVTMQNKISELETEQKKYANIAFFMQIFSLLLIVVRRDMFEHSASSTFFTS